MPPDPPRRERLRRSIVTLRLLSNYFQLLQNLWTTLLQPQSAANAFHNFHHHSKIYLLTGFIMKIEPRVFSINQARVLSLTGMLNSATMASIYLFLLNQLVKKCSIGKLKHMPNNGRYLLALDLFTFVHGYRNIGLDVDLACMFGKYPLKNISYWSLQQE